MSELGGQAQSAELGSRERFRLEREAALRAQVEVAQREQQEAIGKLERIENQVKERRLSSEQASTITANARQSCRLLGVVNVTAANSNREAQTYGLDFVRALRAAGCASELMLPIPGLTADVMGIHVGVRDPTNLAAGAKDLARILSSAGIAFTISPIKSDFFPDAPFVLVIGAK